MQSDVAVPDTPPVNEPVASLTTEKIQQKKLEIPKVNWDDSSNLQPDDK
jgi:hypothetical protein